MTLRPDDLLNHWVPNPGSACTSAAVLTALGGLGGKGLPGLEEATRTIARRPWGSPRVRDYHGIPFLRRAPIDSRIEEFARRSGVLVRSTTRLSLIPWRVRMPEAGQVLIANLAYGQEAPGKYGWFGIHLLRPKTWTVGGHSVVVAGPDLSSRGWLVVDSNHRGVQHWPRPGLAVTTTRIELLT